MKPAFPCWPIFEDDVIEAAVRVLRSGKTNYLWGEEGPGFEREFAKYIGVKHSVAVANGTIALECCLRAVGIKANDEVIVTPRSFIASVSPVVLLGAKPVFADVDLNTQNISASSIARVLTPRTRAILLVHFAGLPCDMGPILTLARKHKLRVIEDCAQALGAKIGNRRVGSFGDVAAFSFCQDKILSTGEGGMVTTNDPKIWKRAWAYKDHGKSWDSVFVKKHPPGYQWYHSSFGTNGRLTEVQSAMARVQLPKVDGWLKMRERNSRHLQSGLASYDSVRTLSHPTHLSSANYKFHCFVVPAALKRAWTRTRIVEEIRKKAIPCLVGSCPEIYLEKAFPKKLRPKKRLTNARELGETSMLFPIYPTLTEQHMEEILAAARIVLDRATRPIVRSRQSCQPKPVASTLTGCEF